MTREEAIGMIKDDMRLHHDYLSGNYRKALRMAISALEQPEIIRCKDCEHWDTTWQNDFAPNYHYCPLADGTRRYNFYCADADMRGEQE